MTFLPGARKFNDKCETEIFTMRRLVKDFFSYLAIKTYDFGTH